MEVTAYPIHTITWQSFLLVKDKIVLRRSRKVLPQWVQSWQMKSEEKLVIDVTLVHGWCWTDVQKSGLGLFTCWQGFWRKAAVGNYVEVRLQTSLAFRNTEPLLYRLKKVVQGLQKYKVVLLDACWWVWQASGPDLAQVFGGALSLCLSWDCGSHLWLTTKG